MPATAKKKTKSAKTKPAKPKSRLSKLAHGFIVGNAGNDPSGISTYTVAGAQTGFSLILLLLLTSPLLINTQAICARIGDVTKKGLASVTKLYYGRTTAILLMLIVIFANLLIIGGNFTAIASALNLLLPQYDTVYFLPLIAGLLWYIIVFKNFELLSRILTGLGIIFLAYVFSAFLIHPHWPSVLRSILIPDIQFTSQFWLVALAVLGTTITPFMFYWQVTEEVEDHPSVKDVGSEIGQVSFGLLYANIIAAFIILTSALTLYRYNISVDSFAEAATALRPLAGDLAYILFSIGIIGSGLLAIPVLTSTTAYTIAETFNWKTGINKKINQAKGFYAVLTLSFFIGLAIALYRINPIKILFYSQALNGLIAPILLALIINLASKSVIMKQYVIGRAQKFLGWLTVAIMAFAGLAAITLEIF